MTHSQAAKIAPTEPVATPSRLQRAMLAAGQGDWAQARIWLEQAVQTADECQQARFLLWEVCQVLGDRDAAVAYLRAAVAVAPLVLRPSATPQRRVLALTVPGDFQANLPVAMLLTESSTELYTYWLHDPAQVLANPLMAAEAIPAEIDCVFIAIAEDRRHTQALQAAEALAAALGKPVINPAARIALAARDTAATLLQGVPGAIVPTQRLLPREALQAAPVAFPVIIRPRQSHAGNALSQIADAAALAAYLAEHADDAFYVAPFIDYRNADGQWRKYRVIFVDGVPWPFHMAVHDDWAVWYYNAGMDRDPQKQAEERQFLNNFASVFPPPAMAALREIAARVGLDYFGLDCGLLDDGRVVVFEVETGMIVHDRDEGPVYAYKTAPARRILRAAEAMVDRRIVAG